MHGHEYLQYAGPLDEFNPTQETVMLSLFQTQKIITFKYQNLISYIFVSAIIRFAENNSDFESSEHKKNGILHACCLEDGYGTSLVIEIETFCQHVWIRKKRNEFPSEQY